MYKDYYQAKVKTSKIRRIVDVPSTQEAIGFFDGAIHGGFCAARVVLRLNNDHFFKLRLNCGHGTNTKA